MSTQCNLVNGSVLPAGVDPFSRYGRSLRACAMFERRNPGVRGAYKDLEGLLGAGPGQILN